MYKIVRKKELNPTVTLMDIEAPFIARKAKAGQFIIFRIDEMGERVPLTVAGTDKEAGTVTIIFQKVGFTTTCFWSMSVMTWVRSNAALSTGSIHTVCQMPVQRVYIHSNWSLRMFCLPAGCLPVRVSL